MEFQEKLRRLHSIVNCQLQFTNATQQLHVTLSPLHHHCQGQPSSSPTHLHSFGPSLWQWTGASDRSDTERPSHEPGPQQCLRSLTPLCLPNDLLMGKPWQLAKVQHHFGNIDCSRKNLFQMNNTVWISTDTCIDPASPHDTTLEHFET